MFFITDTEKILLHILHNVISVEFIHNGSKLVLIFLGERISIFSWHYKMWIYRAQPRIGKDDQHGTLLLHFSRGVT